MSDGVRYQRAPILTVGEIDVIDAGRTTRIAHWSMGPTSPGTPATQHSLVDPRETNVGGWTVSELSAIANVAAAFGDDVALDLAERVRTAA